MTWRQWLPAPIPELQIWWLAAQTSEAGLHSQRSILQLLLTGRL